MEINKRINFQKNFSRVAYISFLLLALANILIDRSYSSATTNLAVALVFDPFDQTQKWENRPFYHKLWLMVHLGVFLFSLLYTLKH